MSETQNNIPATFRISKIFLNSFQESIPTNIETTKPPNEFTFEVTSGAKLHPQKKLIEIIITVKVFLDKEKLNKISSIETSSLFEIINFDDVIINKEGNLFIPDMLLAALISISVSTTRGMLIIKASNPFFQNVYLPVINPTDLITKDPSKKIKIY